MLQFKALSQGNDVPARCLMLTIVYMSCRQLSAAMSGMLIHPAAPAVSQAATNSNLWYPKGRSLRLEPMDSQGLHTLGA